ncbi:DUF1573 domain-containing protein [Fusibacter paucivorans]|uniref:DUF1573 domain-containing protein n=1 Tax=Fusibacter paucivorans TaxID=76009 RepID=A0ABS5PT76_9FIRM|nr:DUF1573 domain-containing protein [Fusibacter paucivorans]MBS7528370.1 DUF1573 domain-containing protein [Fusibacter paucivorans]
MKDVIYDEFQNKVDEVLIRHNSLLDILSKMGDASSKTNRAVIKAITNCGCITLDTLNVTPPEDASYEDLKHFRNDHIKGELCPTCREKIEAELGNLEYYIAALCNSLDLSLYDVVLKEYKKINTLGKYSLY